MQKCVNTILRDNFEEQEETETEEFNDMLVEIDKLMGNDIDNLITSFNNYFEHSKYDINFLEYLKKYR